MLGRHLFVAGACCALGLVVDTPAHACSCTQPTEWIDLAVEEVSVDGVVVAKTSEARARLETSYHTLDGDAVRGASFVTSDGRTEFYEPVP